MSEWLHGEDTELASAVAGDATPCPGLALEEWLGLIPRSSDNPLRDAVASPPPPEKVVLVFDAAGNWKLAYRTDDRLDDKTGYCWLEPQNAGKTHWFHDSRLKVNPVWWVDPAHLLPYLAGERPDHD